MDLDTNPLRQMIFVIIFSFRCKTTKKKVVKRKKIKKKMVLNPQRRGNVTSVEALQRKPALNKKAVLQTKIQDILSGRSRFVIRKVPVVGDRSSSGEATSNGRQKEKVHNPPSVSRSNEKVKTDRCCLLIFFVKCSNVVF